MKDMSLKEGVKIHVKGTGKRHVSGSTAPKKSGGGGLLGLKPPPPAGSVVHVKTAQEIAEANAAAKATTNTAVSTNATIDDDEWGDFT